MTRYPLLRTATALALAAQAYAGVALAQGTDEFGPYGGQESAGQAESRQDFAIEVRFGPYLPRVDSEFDGGATPFRDIFGKKNRLMAGFEFDWQALRIDRVLNFGPGIGLSYTSMSADAPLMSGEGRADQSTSLKLMPSWAVGVLRVDALSHRTPIPLVFSAKLGLGYALWWSRDGSKPARSEGTRGRGASYGLVYAGGVLLDLSFLEPTRARRMDSLSGINHTYFFWEFYALELDGFGSGDVMNVGDRTWTMGLTFEF